jgi:methyl-accepting chemotaxis protein
MPNTLVRNAKKKEYAMTIKRLLQVTAIGYSVTLLVIMSLFFTSSATLKAHIEGLVRHDQAFLLNLGEMYAQGLQSGQALRNILINEHDEKAKENYRKADETFLKAHKQASSIASGKDAENLKKIGALWGEDEGLKAKIQELALSGNKGEAIALLNDQETPKWRETKNLLLETLEEQKSLVMSKVEANSAFMRNNTVIVGAVIAFALAGSLWALLFIHGRIIKPLYEFVNKVETIAKGNLRVSLADNREDEMGMLSRSINGMVTFLRETIESLISSVHLLGSMVKSLQTKSEHASEGAREQSSQSHQIATAAEEMSQTIIDIAKNASVVMDTSNQAMKTATEGKRIADMATDCVNGVNSSTEELANMIRSLNERAGLIDNIVTVINEIADQTNLLALNAAIEAARAGEQGKGFAVVADEVRKLAEKTLGATKEISQMIGAVQDDSQKTMQSMGAATGKVLGATEQIKLLGGTLTEIVDSVKSVQDQIGQIATAVEEQSSTSEEIARNIASTSAIAQKIEGLSGEVMEDARSLSDIAENLRIAGSRFTIEG